MANNVEVQRHNNESSANVIRRFTKRVQNSGIVRRKRDNRYHTRIKSENVRQAARLKKIVKKETYELAYKLGKTTEPTKRR